MPLTPSSSPTTPGSGINIATYVDGTGKEYQVIVIVDANGAPLTTDGQNLNINLGTGIRQDLDSITIWPRGTLAGPVLSANGLGVPVAGKLVGLFVSATTGTPAITVYDGNGTGGTVKVPTFAPTAATLYSFPSIALGTSGYVAVSNATCICYYDSSTG